MRELPEKKEKDLRATHPLIASLRQFYFSHFKKE